jgi:hypothetical protein
MDGHSQAPLVQQDWTNLNKTHAAQYSKNAVLKQCRHQESSETHGGQAMFSSMRRGGEEHGPGETLVELQAVAQTRARKMSQTGSVCQCRAVELGKVRNTVRSCTAEAARGFSGSLRSRSHCTFPSLNIQAYCSPEFTRCLLRFDIVSG